MSNDNGSKRSAAEAGLSNSGLPGENLRNIKSRRQSDPSPTDPRSPRLPVTMTLQMAENHIDSRNNKDDDGAWSIAESRSSRKKRRKLDNDAGIDNSGGGDAYPAVRFNNKPDKVEIKDLQNLVLYLLANGTAPTWLAVKEARQIQKVVVLMIPGLDRSSLEDFGGFRTATATNGISETRNKTHTDSGAEVAAASATSTEVLASSAPETESANGNIPPDHQSSSTNGRSLLHSTAKQLIENMIQVRVPGDTYQNRIHSPLQSMLIAPHPKENKQSKDEKSFQAVRTPISNYIHSADELRDAEYPIHPAAFDNDRDARLENERREKTSQSASAGWVDTKVSSSDSFNQHSSTKKSMKARSQDYVTAGYKVYAVDCEMVLTDDDKYSLARLSVLDWEGKTVIDKFVKPSLPIKNYFTQFSGITPKILEKVTTTLGEIQQELLTLLTPDAILLGHSLESDLNALKMTHPHIVDTSIIFPHPRGLPLRSSLKYLANKYLKREIQKGGADGHDSVEDACAVLDLVRLKCEKGPRFGTLDANGESLFRRIAKWKRTDGSGAMRETAIIEYGTPERGFGKDATYKIACESDDDIVKGVLRAAHGDDHSLDSEDTAPPEHNDTTPGEADKKVEPPDIEQESLSRPPQDPIPTGGVDFIWSRFRDLEAARGWNTPPSPLPANPTAEDLALPTSPLASSSSQTSTSPPSLDPALQSTTTATLTRLADLFESLPPKTLLIVYSGTGDMRPVLRLQQLHTQYRKEFKVKKWDQLAVKWTDVEEQKLKRAVDKARRGIGTLAVR